jgi:SagB-type dehydrogenase family enzyme
VLHSYARGLSIRAEPFLMQVLEEFGTWRSLGHYLRSVDNAARNTAEQLVTVLHRDGWLRRRDDPRDSADVALDDWTVWNPSAGFFHTATKNTRFLNLDDVLESLSKQAKTWPMPTPVKSYRDANAIPLPPPIRQGPFPATLRDRRTWRQFDRRPVALNNLATLLDLTAGVQHWVTAKNEGRVPLKTSPSGGARHPIELYVLARRIRSLPEGIYHYAADRHVLERLPGSGTPPPFDELLPTQWWYRDAAALVLLTAVFERMRWRYHAPRAYRAVLIEAGHVCQTFCLTATWLGLAPFCSMAIADGAAERLLGIDGIRESVIYAAGIGTRPPLHGRPPGSLPRLPSNLKTVPEGLE